MAETYLGSVVGAIYYNCELILPEHQQRPKSSLFILLFDVIRRLKLKPISEQKVENIFVVRHVAKLPVLGSL